MQLVLRGMQAGVAAVIADVVISMGWDVLREKTLAAHPVMVRSFIAACFFKVNVMLIIVVCGGIGHWTPPDARRTERRGVDMRIFCSFSGAFSRSACSASAAATRRCR